MPRTEIAKSSEVAASWPHDFLAAMRDEMDRLFESVEPALPRLPLLYELPRWPSAFRRTAAEAVVPDFDVHENAKSIMIEAELPGVDEKDISITLSDDLLTIRGEKKQEREEEGETHYLCERSFGTFERRLRLPKTVDEDKLEARLEKGVLKITAPKRSEAGSAERKIEVKKA